MAEIKLFNEWLETHDISASAVALWHALMHIAFRGGWKPEFSVPITVVMSRTKMSRSTIYRERESLRRHGLIDYDLGDGRQSSYYRIIGFENKFVSHSGTQSETQTGEPSQVVSHTETQTEMSDEIFGVVSHSGTQDETQTRQPSQVVSHTETQHGTQNEKPPEVVSHSGTQNPDGVLLEADFANGKIEKSPIYINKDIDIGGCGGKKKNADSKSKSPKKKKPEFDLSFIGDEVWATLVESWLEYKRSRNESYKSDMSVKKFHTMLRNLSRGDPATARRIIDKSIANNWAGIFELTDTAMNSRGQPSRPVVGQPATGQRIGQIKQPEDEERRRKLLEKFGGSGDNGKNKT